MRKLSSKDHEVCYFNYEQALIHSKYCLEINKKVYLVVLSNVDEIHNGFSKQWQELKVEKILKGSLGPGFDPIMDGKVCLRCKDHGEGDGIKSRLSC